MFKRVTGTEDILPEEASRWQVIEETARNVFLRYNYREIRTPVIEEVGLFSRSLGDTAEIVQKQMFTIKNEEDIYVLRPEGTSSIVRAYIENNLNKTTGFIKLYYIGPMFRRERPQKGRLRQFHHLGCEVIGSYESDVDIEVISLADALLKGLNINGSQIKLNSLGCPEDRNKLKSMLSSSLKDKENDLCEDCKIRIKRNILRILDCKNKACQEIVKNLNIQNTYLCAECKEHFKKVTTGLDALKIKYTISPHLVRGLDYYTRTVFEITHPDLGAQDAIGAGGRYDNLISDLGGSPCGAIGFAFGMERILLASSTLYEPSWDLVYIISLGDEAKQYSMKLINELRLRNIRCDTDYENRSLKGAMRRANDLKARFVVIVGEDELKKNTVTLKDMKSGEQKEVRAEDLIRELKC